VILRRKYNLDIVPGGLPLLIRVSRRDTSSTLVFSLFAGKGVLDVPAGTSAAFRGAFGSAPASYSVVDSIPTVTVDLTIEMTQKAGWIPFEIVLKSTADGEEYTLVTATLYLDVRG
jgi:hypothetical protein